MQPQVPGVRQASARLLTLPSRGGTLPSLCLFPHLLPTNTRVVVKTEGGDGFWSLCLTHGRCLPAPSPHLLPHMSAHLSPPPCGAPSSLSSS